MKRIKSILTVLMAAVFALSLVPAGAFAEDPTNNPINAYDNQVQGADPTTIANHNTNGQTGVLGTQHGTMTIANAKANETYEVYRLFELASFDDEDVSTGVHGTEDKDEAYSYVINNDGNNKWYTFLTTQKPVNGSVPYAVLSNAEPKDDAHDGFYTLEEAADAGYYFVIDAEAVTVNGTGTYHVITPTSLFSHAGATGNNRDDMGDATDRSDEGVSAGEDYVATTNSNKVVQDFAQEALRYAVANEIGAVKTVTAGANGGSTNLLTADDNAPLGYYLVGTSMGTLAALDTTNTEVTVYEKNDEPTIEKAILKKGEGFDDSDWEDLVAKSAASKQKAIDDATAAKAKADAALAEANDALANDPDNAELIAAAATAQTAATAAQTALQAAQNAPDPVWVKNTDADHADYVAFRTVITAQQGAKNYRLHDAMEDGLKLVTEAPTADTYVTDRYEAANAPAAPKVYLVRGNAVHTINATGGVNNAFTNYVLTTGNEIDSAECCDFEIEFKDATVIAQGTDTDNKVVFYDSTGTKVDVKDGDKIVVVYWAKVLGPDDDKYAALWYDKYDGDVAHTRVKDTLGNDISDQIAKPDYNGNGRNDNYTVLTYGNRSHTQWDKASATVYQLDIAKTDAYDVSAEASPAQYNLLQGAKFRIYKATTGTSEVADPIAVTKTVDNVSVTYTQEGPALLFDGPGSNADAPQYMYKGDVATAVDASGTQLVTGKSASLMLMGLEAGHYILVEEEAPAGYNKLAHPIVVTITGDIDSDGFGSFLTNDVEDYEGYITCRFTANDGSEQTGGPTRPVDTIARSRRDGLYTTVDAIGANGGLRVVNQTGQELPSTGGIGTTIFYVAGTVLVVGAAVMLVAKRRMGAEA